jgi:hypothetical protein
MSTRRTPQLSLLLVPLTLAFFVSPADAQFATSDLDGDWSLYRFQDLRSRNFPRWTRGTFNVDALGNVTSGSVASSAGANETVTGGSLGIDERGFVTGSVAYRAFNVRF